MILLKNKKRLQGLTKFANNVFVKNTARRALQQPQAVIFQKNTALWALLKLQTVMFHQKQCPTVLKLDEV